MIPSDRKIYTKLYIGRTDGETWEDVTEYLSRLEIEQGDVSGVGTGSGVDGVVRRMSFTLHNDENNSFAPRDRNSSWNQFSGSYAPLLWPNREVQFQARVTAESYVHQEVIGVGDGSTTVFYLEHVPIVSGSVEIDSAGASYTWSELNNITWAEATNIRWNSLKSTTEYTSDFSVNTTTGAVTFTTPPPENITVLMNYRHYAADTGYITLFHGYLGDSIATSPFSVSCECRDLSKRLQDCYIETETQYGSEGGTPAETVMQSILDDNLGAGAVTLYTPVSPGFAILNTDAAKIGYMSVWDALQKITSMFGWFCGYRWDSGTSQYKLTLMEPPRSMVAVGADFVLDYEDDFYVQDLDISDRDVRNAIKVTYRDISTGDRASVTVTDSASIAAYGRRAMQIEEDDASMIDTSAEATDLANAALSDLKDLTSTTKINMPFLPEMDIFKGIVVINPQLSSTNDFYGVESFRHSLDFDSHKYRTEITGCGRIIGGKRRWLKMQTRPGAAGRPNTRNVQMTETISTPTGLTVTSAIRGLTVTLNANPEITWDGFEIHVSTSSGFTPSSSTLKAKGRAARFDLVDLTPGTTYYVKARAYDTSGNYSGYTSQVSAVAGRIQTEDIEDGATTTEKIADGALTNRQIFTKNDNTGTRINSTSYSDITNFSKQFTLSEAASCMFIMQVNAWVVIEEAVTNNLSASWCLNYDGTDITDKEARVRITGGEQFSLTGSHITIIHFEENVSAGTHTIKGRAKIDVAGLYAYSGDRELSVLILKK
ncbi:MAG: hypothetical protein JRI54_00135 [Deltaproteobacteria bacterium]|nr:hypothetical protein [Deltaproteobacteria bacterium]